MFARAQFRVGLATLLSVCLAGVCLPAPPAAGNTLVPQTALSLCSALKVASQEKVIAGTILAVSADGRYRAELVHTPEGAFLILRSRDTGEERHVRLKRPTLSPGVTWRVAEMAFSPAGDLLAVRSVGSLWVLSTETAQVLYRIGPDAGTQTYPGQSSLAGRELAVSFWPQESYLADVPTKKPVEVKLYDATSGQTLGRLALQLPSSNQWTELRLSPDGKWLAVLLRPTSWPGKGRLILFAAETGKLLWEHKTDAEDAVWSRDGRALLILGDRLEWLNPAKGKKIRRAEGGVGSSEFQQLRLSEPANAAIGQFARFSSLRRLFARRDKSEEVLTLWRLDTGQQLCEQKLDSATNIYPWVTARGEVITLEETYEVQPPLRLLRSARIVTYKLQIPPAPAPAAPKNQEPPKADAPSGPRP